MKLKIIFHMTLGNQKLSIFENKPYLILNKEVNGLI